MQLSRPATNVHMNLNEPQSYMKEQRMCVRNDEAQNEEEPRTAAKRENDRYNVISLLREVKSQHLNCTNRLWSRHLHRRFDAAAGVASAAACRWGRPTPHTKWIQYKNRVGRWQTAETKEKDTTQSNKYTHTINKIHVLLLTILFIVFSSSFSPFGFCFAFSVSYIGTHIFSLLLFVVGVISSLHPFRFIHALAHAHTLGAFRWIFLIDRCEKKCLFHLFISYTGGAKSLLRSMRCIACLDYQIKLRSASLWLCLCLYVDLFRFVIVFVAHFSFSLFSSLMRCKEVASNVAAVIFYHIGNINVIGYCLCGGDGVVVVAACWFPQWHNFSTSS